MKKASELTCNQCNKQAMQPYPVSKGTKLYFCGVVDCPNFALLQIPVEYLDEKSKPLK